MVLVDRIESAYREKKHKGEKETCHHCWKDSRIVMEVLKETMQTREQIKQEDEKVFDLIDPNDSRDRMQYLIYVRLGEILDMMPNPYDVE